MIILQEAKDPQYAEQRLDGVRNAIRDHRLLTLIVEPTSKCNLACTFCDLHSGRFREQSPSIGEMTFATFKRIVDQLACQPFRLKELQYHGNGEPLLKKHLADFVAYARLHNVADKYRLTTNGTMLTRDTMVSLIESGIHEIHVSLDVCDPEKYKVLKGRDLFARVEKNIASAIDYVEHHKNCKFFIKYALPHVDGKYGFASEDAEAIVNKYRDVCEHSEYVHLKGMPVVTLLDGIQEQRREFNQPCEVPFFSLFVKFDGTVAACCADLFGKLTFGNTNEQDLTDILRSEGLKKFRLLHLNCELAKFPICLYCGNRTAADLTTISDELKRMVESS
jgi:MoaA/NifB/PqqE/SkfB family radical SAM enzyme